MHIVEGVSIGISAIRSNKLRSLLTTLGIIIGVAAVLAMIAIGDGAKALVLDEVERFGGANMFKLYYSYWKRVGNKWIRNRSNEHFTYEDALAIEAECPSVKFVVPRLAKWERVLIQAAGGTETRSEYKYYQLSTRLVYLDNEHLNSLFESKGNTRGWGENHIIKLGKSKVFVKRIPLTDLEYNHMFSTKNLYDLPTYYNYGVGSAGFGVFRELLTHIRTTNWVLQGAIENFPLMYHYRIMPRSGEKKDLDTDWHGRYVKYWNSNENIGKYIVDRTNAKYEVVLFLEYIPYIFSKWFERNINQLNLSINEILNAITFLRENGIIHFDVHFNNILTDGSKPYLTDFGLALDKRFDLSETERTFFRKNTHYDS